VTRETGLEHLTLLGVSPPDLVTVAAAAGFDAVGLRISPAADGDRPWPVWPGSPMLAETIRRCADTGVKVLDVEAVRLGALPVDYTATLEAAAALGARYVNAICDDADLGRLSDSFAALTAAAAGYGIRAVVEFMAYRSVRTLAAAVVIAGRSDGGGVLVDALHVQRCGVPLAALRAVDPALISYVQLCDAPLAAPGAGPASADAMHEARGARLLPGDGRLPLGALLDALPAGIPVAVEAPQSADGGDSPLAFAARARRALDSVLSRSTSQLESPVKPQAKERP
jgi:sugar phosphate isomerase/epimerase